MIKFQINKIFKYKIVNVFLSISINMCFVQKNRLPGCAAQSVTCLATDACLTADPGVESSIPAPYHTFVEFDHGMISSVILLPSADSFKRVVVSYKQKYVHELLVNRLFKPAQEKMLLGELTVSPDLGCKARKQTNNKRTISMRQFF